MATRPPTANDVAKRAGVSRMTVSSVLNGTGGNVRVSAATRERVLASAAELEYSPHPVARALRSRRSRIIGFVPRSARGTPYEQPVSYLLSIHVARAAMRRGYHVVEASAETAASRGSDELLRFLLGWRVDGVIFDWPESDGEVGRFVEKGLPIVQLMRPRFAVPTPTITVDAGEGIAAAVDHLAELGHRRIAFIGSGVEHSVERVRYDHFVAALGRHDIELPDDCVWHGADASIATGHAATHAFLALPHRPTAVFAAGDNLALGVLRALYEAELHVPRDVSLVSYDDTFVANLYPPLTSVGQPFPDIAERATSLIADGLDSSADGIDEATRVVLPARLTVRDSTGPPRCVPAPRAAGGHTKGGCDGQLRRLVRWRVA